MLKSPMDGLFVQTPSLSGGKARLFTGKPQAAQSCRRRFGRWQEQPVAEARGAESLEDGEPKAVQTWTLPESRG